MAVDHRKDGGNRALRIFHTTRDDAFAKILKIHPYRIEGWYKPLRLSCRGSIVHAVDQDSSRRSGIDPAVHDRKIHARHDFRFAAENPKRAFFVVKLLEESGYDGSRHFDAHAYRTEDEAGVWAFARGCMRSYLILKEKVKQFQADGEIQSLLNDLRAGDSGYTGPAAGGGYSREAAAALQAQQFDVDALAARGRRYEELDQLVMELLLGVR